jgi:hypothetical protein
VSEGLNTAQEEYTKDDVVWSIYDESKINEEDENLNLVEYNKVGATGPNSKQIPNLSDGKYTLIMPGFYNKNKKAYTPKKKIIVKGGHVDIDSAKEAVAEFLNETGDWHCFIEAIYETKKKNVVWMFLGS